VVKVALNVPELSSNFPGTHKIVTCPQIYFVFAGTWSVRAGTLFRGLESWDSVSASDQSRLVLLLT